MALKRGRQLRRQSIVVEAQAGREPGGGTTQQWRAVKTIEGRLVPATAAEAVKMQQRDAVITHKLLTDTDPQTTNAHRYRIGARIFKHLGTLNAHETERFWVTNVEEQGIMARNPGS